MPVADLPPVTRTPGPSTRTLKLRQAAADAAAVAVGLLLAFVLQSMVRSESELGVQGAHLVLAMCDLPGVDDRAGGQQAVPVAGHRAARRGAQAPAQRRPRQRRHRSSASPSSASSRSSPASGSSSVLLLVLLALVVERAIARRVVTRMRRERRIGRRIIIVGTDADAIGLLHATQRRPELGYQAVGFVGPDDLGPRGGCSRLGDLDEVEAALQATGATGVMISLASVPPEVVNRMTRAAHRCRLPRRPLVRPP